MQKVLCLPALAVGTLSLLACAEGGAMSAVGVDDPSKARPIESSTSAAPGARTSMPKSIPAEGGPPVDGSIIPGGDGWFCFDTPSSYMQCERSATGCEQDHSVALGPGIAIGECSKYERIYAFTMKDSDGQVRLYPYPSLAECLSPVFGRKSAGASGCAELR